MYDQVLGLLLAKRPKSRCNDSKAEQAFYDNADWNVPAGLLRFWSRFTRSRRGIGG